MFKKKYTISILDSKWNQMKTNIKVNAIPRMDELIFVNEKYYSVLNIIHMLNDKHEVFVVVTENYEKKS